MGMNEFALTEPLVARTFTVSFYKFQNGGGFGGLNEIQGFDGARWYSIEPDSMYIRADILSDSLANTPLSPILNGQVTYLYDYAILNSDTLIIKNPNEIPQQFIDKRVLQKTTVLIRSNYTWDANITHTAITYGKKPSLIVMQKNVFGDYKLFSKNGEQVVLNVRYRSAEQNSIDGKQSIVHYKLGSGKMQITKTNLNLDGLIDMLISY
jgi:hypothetical protein